MPILLVAADGDAAARAADALPHGSLPLAWLAAEGKKASTKMRTSDYAASANQQVEPLDLQGAFAIRIRLRCVEGPHPGAASSKT